MHYLKPLLAAVAATVAFAAFSETTFVAGVGGGNGKCGEFQPEGFVEFDHDSADRPAHFDVRVGPNGGCTGQGVSINAQVSQRWDINDDLYGVITAGYDQRTIAHEYLRDDVNGDGFKLFRGVGVRSVELSAGGGVRFADGWTARAAVNVADTGLGPFGGSDDSLTTVVGFSGELVGVEVDVSVLEPLQEAVTEMRLTRAEGRVQIGASVLFNSSQLTPTADPVLGGYELAGAPDTLYSFDVGWRF